MSVQDEAPMGRSKGTVAVLALLLSVLFSAVDVPVNRGATGSRPSAIGQNDSGKAGTLLRTDGRIQDDERRGGEPVLLAGAGGAETMVVSRRPADAAAAHDQSAPTRRPAFAYRARAPPAAV